MGDEFYLDDHSIAQVEPPAKREDPPDTQRRAVSRNGGKGVDLRHRRAGIYRVEAYLWRAFRYRPWIFSNRSMCVKNRLKA